MARIARHERYVFRDDTPDGTLITLSPGEAVEAEFVALNDGDQRGLFHFEVEGLDERWTPNIGTAYAKAIDAGRRETLKLTLAPPPGSAARRSEFLVNIVSDGEVKFQKRVGLEIAPPEPAPPEPAVVVEPPTTAPRVSPDAETMSEPAKAPRRRTVAKTAPRPVEKPVASSPPPPQDPPEAPTPPAPQAVIAPAPAPEPPRLAPTAPVADDGPEDDEFVDVAETYRNRFPAQTAEPEQEKIEEPNLISPRPDSRISLKPGETMLLRFPYANETAQVREYALDVEDTRFDNEREWVERVKVRMALRNGDGELQVRLRAPLKSRPGGYPLTIVRTAESAGVEYCALTLEVQASPAVSVSVKDNQTQAKGGPSDDPEFTLLVRSAGNMDTSFRIGVTRPRAGTDTALRTMPVYESADDKWRYLFDKEMGTVLVAKPGYELQDISVRLRVARQNIGWWDFSRKDTLQVTAVPVTDVENAGKAENTVALTVSRWQVPRGITHILMPLLLLFLIFGPLIPITPLPVQNSYLGSQGNYFVFGNAQNPTPAPQLRWTPAFLPVTVQTPSQLARFQFGGYTDTHVPAADKGLFQYDVNGRKVPVQFVPVTATGALRLVLGSLTGGKTGSPVTLSPETDPKFPAGVKVVTASFTLGSQTHLVLNPQNVLSRSSNQSTAVTYWAMQRPTSFKVDNLPDQRDVDSGQTSTPITIKAPAGGVPSGTQDDMILATTDGDAQIIDIKLTAK